MKNPTVKQVQALIARFESVIKKWPEGVLDMDEPDVRSGQHNCGTTHCHAGWYAVAYIDEGREFPPEVEDNNMRRITCIDGIDLMSRDLGFRKPVDLRSWAQRNPEIWGNEFGDFMFCKASAFGPEGGDDAENMQDIVAHWKTVLKTLEQQHGVSE